MSKSRRRLAVAVTVEHHEWCVTGGSAVVRSRRLQPCQQLDTNVRVIKTAATFELRRVARKVAHDDLGARVVPLLLKVRKAFTREDEERVPIAPLRRAHGHRSELVTREHVPLLRLL